MEDGPDPREKPVRGTREARYDLALAGVAATEEETMTRLKSFEEERRRAGMRERVGVLGGSLYLDNWPGGGARVLAEIPWPNDSDRHAARAPALEAETVYGPQTTERSIIAARQPLPHPRTVHDLDRRVGGHGGSATEARRRVG
jgi:hypothetical protein